MPKKFEQEDDFKISEDGEESKIPTFFNNKKNPETKLKKTAAEFHPKAPQVDDDFIITETPEDKFENSGPSENSNTINQMAQEEIPEKIKPKLSQKMPKKPKDKKKQATFEMSAPVRMGRF